MQLPDDQPAPWVMQLAELMDSKFEIPGTSIRFGLDPILGLLPGVGDTVTAIIGAAIFSEAHRLRVGKRVMAKMVANLAIDWLIGLVPLVDIVFDTAFKAHIRNARLLQEVCDSRAVRPRKRV